MSILQTTNTRKVAYTKLPDISVNCSQTNLPSIHIKRAWTLSNMLRNVFFYPLKCLCFIQSKEKATLTKIQDHYHSLLEDDPRTSVYYRGYETITDKFKVFERKLVLETPCGSKIEIPFRVYEPKGLDPSEPVINHVVYGGNICSLNMLGTNLSEAVEHSTDDFNLRILNFSVYDVFYISPEGKKCNFSPYCLQDSAAVIAHILSALKDEYKQVHSVAFHSLSTILFTEAVRMLEPSQVDILPNLMIFDRGSSSVWNASAKYWLTKYILYPSAWFLGWGSGSENKFCEFFENSQKEKLSNREIMVFRVLDDHYFLNTPTISEVSQSRLKALGLTVTSGCAAPPCDIMHKRNHHGAPRHLVPFDEQSHGVSFSRQILTRLKSLAERQVKVITDFQQTA